MVIRDDRSISTGLSNQHALRCANQRCRYEYYKRLLTLAELPAPCFVRIIDNGPITEKVVLPHRLFIHRLRLYLLVAQGWVEKVGLDPFGIASHGYRVRADVFCPGFRFFNQPARNPAATGRR